MEKIDYVNKIIVHHTGRQYDHPFFVKIRHKILRGREDTGYHYLIGNGLLGSVDGKIYIGRNELYQGAHVFGHNEDSLGICLLGNFDKYYPTPTQYNSLYSLLGSKINQHSLCVRDIFGHNELLKINNSKTCPGKNIDMNLIRNNLIDILQ